MSKSKKKSLKKGSNSNQNTSETSYTSQYQQEQNSEDILNQIKFKKLNIKFRNESQKLYWDIIDNNEITFCCGPAGTGKTFLSISKSLDLISKENSKFKKIILIKPAVEAEEKLGALPGDLEQKLEPYIYSYFYIYEKILGKRKLEKLIEKGIISVMALAYLRGINIDNAVVIADEMQNSSPRQIKTLLTRIGENCKMIITGDKEQSDRFKNYKESGLFFAMEKLKDLTGIGMFDFRPEDIVRNPIISVILEKFNGDVQ